MLKRARPAVPSTRQQATAERFDWPLAYEAELFLRGKASSFLAMNAVARVLAARMRAETATDFFEWMDYAVLPREEETQLRALGFEQEKNETPHGERVMAHPHATLPRVLLTDEQPFTVALKPESVADFAARVQCAGEIEGAPFSRFRRVLVAEENATRLEAVERLAYRGFVPEKPSAEELKGLVHARELWRARRRRFADENDGFAEANKILDEVLSLVDRDAACQLFFEQERAYWQRRNRAAQFQKARQDKLGLGWGNHDHHTFRCSRARFVDIIQFLLRLGFEKRERYYAGAEAGWGAQILEHPVTNIVVFADVDLMPEETEIDFSETKLEPAPCLRTVGLWVGLHGESFLEAGMHHLEARFDFDVLRSQLAAEGIGTMKPFSDFAFLRQAFTEGEYWTVSGERLARLLEAKLITEEQAGQFLREGALGSHLENLQRHGGYKGFNQESVSAVIEATDPRMQHHAEAA